MTRVNCRALLQEQGGAKYPRRDLIILGVMPGLWAVSALQPQRYGVSTLYA